MIARISVGIRKIKRWFSRSYWAIRLFHLPKSEEPASRPGLVMIQIDGLSFTQFHRSLKNGNLPFLKYLIEKQKYADYVHYSGLPSTTPAVQGELFYGVKGCVPAFNFIDRVSGETFVMYEQKCAAEIENRLSKEGEPLLKGGSSYANVFSGGAQEAHFCAASVGWGGFFKALNPFAWVLILIFHIDALIRTAVLLIVEVIFGFYDSIRGTLSGEKLSMELQFILARVGVCVLLREMNVVGAKIDIARGLPIIHVNFFGYDEQSHRRGPSSAFAHWGLKGIDDAIARLWREARFSERRDYDLWVYSDHGQEDTIPYSVEHGKSVRRVIEGIFNKVLNTQEEEPDEETILPRHESHGSFSQILFPFVNPDVHGIDKSDAKVMVKGMGPITHIYPSLELSPDERESFISQLLLTAKVPVVFTALKNGKVEARTTEGKFTLPEQASEILGYDHPFLNDAAQELVNLCQHPNAGKIIIAGWLAGKQPRTFPLENGSHAGYGTEETKGFALLPTDVPLSARKHAYLRPLDLREAALRHLGRAPVIASSAVKPVLPGTLRIMTYNVHGCVGMDGKLSPDRIARVIARHDLDVVALQELDVRRGRSNKIDQAELIASKLQMSFHFHPSFCLEDEQYGNAILSRYPMRMLRRDALPRLSVRRVFEPRGALWVEVNANGRKFNLVTSHLSLWPAERLLQAEALLGADWVGSPTCEGPVVLCGDFNADPRSLVCKRIACTLRDVQAVLKSHKPRASHLFGRFDHIFVSPDIEVISVNIPKTDLDQVASDHLPVLVELKMNQKVASEQKNAQSLKQEGG